MSIEVHADRALLRSPHRSERYLLITLEAPVAPADSTRPPVNAALVLDRSGSMQGSKLDCAREAAAHAVSLLKPADRFSIVAYDSRVEVLVPTTRATPAAREAALGALRWLGARGCTDLSGGWLQGCQQIAEFLDADAVGRCLLLTDGQANEGITEDAELAHHATELRRRGIATSTFGIGEDFNEHLLQRMAEAGGGNFHFIENEFAIPRVMGMDLGEALETVARGACLEIDAPGIEVSSLNDFPTRCDGATTRLELGALVSGQVVEAVVKLRFPRGEPGQAHRVTVRARDLGAVLDPRDVALAFRHAEAREVEEQPRDRRVDRAVAAIYAARVRRDALLLNRAGRYDDAEALVAGCVRRIESYAADDPALNRTARELAAVRAELAAPMTQVSLKRAHAASIGSMKGRSASGASRRRARGHGLGLWLPEPSLSGAAQFAVAALGDVLQAFSGEVRIGVLDGPDGGTAEGRPGPSVLGVSAELSLVERAAMRDPGSALRMVVVESVLADHWNSHWHPHRATAIVSLRASAGLDPAAFLAYELLLHAPANLSPRYDLGALLHEERRGCLYDLCADTADLPAKLRTLTLCPACIVSLAQLPVPTARMTAGCAAVRSLAAGAPADRWRTREEFRQPGDIDQ